MISKKIPILKNKKEIKLVDQQNQQLYFYFSDLEDIDKLTQIKNRTITNSKSKIIVRWFDFYNSKKYKAPINLKLALQRSLLLIKQIITQKGLNINSLNNSGLMSIIKSNNTIFIEPQFS